VPKPRPGVFRITKNIHNILQGVSHPDQRVSAEEKQSIIDWITENASRYWFSEGGPLCSPQEGGADVVIVSDLFRVLLTACRCSSSPTRVILFPRTLHARFLLQGCCTLGT
jgi:hypothetical protein